ncbi:uncharacterized protein APUU_10372S [Aspergillus puulaauensis]|uniref:DUF1593-domain-containing protein n=1 Tax=Aspergillus puulaauensis TaxID=1220207 RepID=A0A7R8AFI2_9EURO|nr:uncharacterized protein APUU_10372S [Aspergillus puulaauensis]BCS17544.1 hypothetical protein APUU_10372S [Aspergillus puulaauensis]
MQFLLHCLFTIGLLATVQTYPVNFNPRNQMPRTVVTTDMEQDDLASLIRYLLYTNELDTQGLIYSSSRYHWAGDGNGTKFYLPDREYTSPQWTWRWTGTRYIQDIVLKAYAEVYPNLRNHDPFYPSPEELLDSVKIGNIDFEGEMERDTQGSDFIRELLLDTKDSRPLYLQAWGGTSTIARALKSIEEEYSPSSQWANIKATVSTKAVILASGFQDETYEKYIAPQWPDIRVEQFVAAYATWGYNCERGDGNVRGLPDDHVYFTGNWTKTNIQTGPYGKLYRSWLDGQSMPGDQMDLFGDLEKLEANPNQFCDPLGPYDFLSEGDNVVFNPLLKTGIQDPANPALGGWGGRSKQNSSSPNLWQLVENEKNQTGAEDASYTTDRWMAAVQNDFAARMQWTLTPDYELANHPPEVKIANGTTVKARAGSTVTLAGVVSDPDNGTVTTSWWQYLDEGSYPGKVTVTESGNNANVAVPADAKTGQTISIILQGTDDGHFPLTRYGRVFIQVA